VCGLVLKECPPPSSHSARVGYSEISFGLSRSEVEASPEFVIITHGFDGRFDSPNILAEPFGFKEGDEEI
jgi:hypothetical protein